MTTNLDDRNPTPDLAEDNAFFPSQWTSLNQTGPLKRPYAQTIVVPG